MYSLHHFMAMAADKIRTGAYRDALQRVVTPESIVIDIGAGSGILSLLSCQAGARKVYAIEPNDAIHAARELAQANGFADRIEFIQALSTEICLPEKADIVVSDLNGYLPFCAGSLPAIIHAREQLMAPGGVLVPQGADIMGTIAGSESIYNWCLSCSQEQPYGLDFEPVRRYLVNDTVNGGSIKPENCLVEAARLLSLDYRSLASADASGSARWTIQKAGLGHGLCIWFDSILTPDLHISNAPDEPELIYGRKFLPWTKPVQLRVGDRVAVDFHADFVDNDYAFRWSTSIQDGQGRAKASFRQSSQLGVPKQALADDIELRSAGYIAKATTDIEIDRMILNAIDGHKTSRDIAETVAASYPEKFPHWQVAFERVRQLVERYGRT